MTKKHSEETRTKLSGKLKKVIKKRIDEGKCNGRPKGSITFLKLDDHKAYILNNHSRVSLQHMADYLKKFGVNVSRTTLHRYIKINDEESITNKEKTGRPKGSSLFLSIDEHKDFIKENCDVMSLQQLIEYLAEKDINVSRTTMYRYIKSLDISD